MSFRRTVLASGYCALDVVCHNGTVWHAAGGTAANVAANLSYMGWDASLVGRLGRDAPGRRIIHELRTAGVNIELIEREQDVETPVVLHLVDPPRHRFTFTCPACGRRFPKHRPMTTTHLDTVVAERVAPGSTPDVFFFDRASAPAVALAATLREAGTLVFFEPSSPGTADRTAAAAAASHVIKVSAERRANLHDDLLDAREGQWQIETAGAAGLRFRHGREPWTAVEGFAVTDVDSAGAGDWLTAAFIDAVAGPDLLSRSHASVAEALRRAQALPALSCGYVGARTLARVPLKDARALEAALIAGSAVQAPGPPSARRSRARGVCDVCLGA